MFADRTLRGEAMDGAYAEARQRWEPIAEIVQIKGDSETHPDLSPEDEFADFETFPLLGESNVRSSGALPGDYLRSALRTGLQLQEDLKINPYQLGFIGSTDAHTGLASAEEPNFWGKIATDSVPGTKAAVASPAFPVTGWDMSAAGLAAVWAEENTRDAIFAAFMRREVYATTGTRMAVRVFGGWDFPDRPLEITEIGHDGNSFGVPMGATLQSRGAGATAPIFLLEALKDPTGANLDRVQLIKGWVDGDGQSHEKIYEVAWSPGRELDPDGKLATVGNSVNLATGRYSNSIGATQLRARWQDPGFDPGQRAFYYLRVLEIPTPRHSLLDAIALGMDPAETNNPATIQERAYTSPIWYNPE